MATYTSNYGWTKPSGSDNVDISVLNDNLDNQDSVIHNAFLNMAVPFSELSTYAVGDIVLYGTTTYKCHTAVVTPGSWTGSTNWQVYKLSEGGGGGTSDYSALNNKPKINGVELAGNKTTSDLGINADNVMMSDGVTSVEDALSTQRYVTIKSVTADGVKTISQLLDELYPYRKIGAILKVSDYLLYNSRYSTLYGCTSCDGNGTPLLRSAILSASGSKLKTYDCGTNTVSDQSSNVLTSGSVVELFIQL